MKEQDIKILSEYLLKNSVLLYDTVSENHSCIAMIVLSCDSSKGHYDVKIEFEPRENEDNENE